MVLLPRKINSFRCNTREWNRRGHLGMDPILDGCWDKSTLLHFIYCKLPRKMDVHEIQRDFLYVRFGLLLFVNIWSNAWLVSWIFMRYYSRYGVNQVSLRSILSVKLICDLHCTRSVQFGGIVTYLMNETVDNSSSNTTWNCGKKWPVARLSTISTNPA